MKKIDMKKVLGTVIRAGLTVSLVVVVVGLIMFAISPSEDATALRFDELPGALAELSPVAVLNLGLLMLIATPIVGLLSAIVSFTISRDTKFVFVSAFVLILLMVSLALSLLNQV